MIADFALQSLEDTSGNVRRIRNDEIKLAPVQRVEAVGNDELCAIGNAEFLRVEFCDLECCRRLVESNGAGVIEFAQQSQRDATRSGADVANQSAWVVY